MNTKIERIDNVIYCAYCGKELKNYNASYSVFPEPELVCNCKMSKEELKLYEKLKELYNAPLAENLIDIKVENYKSELMGIRKPNKTYATFGNSITIPASTIGDSTTFCCGRE